MDLYLAQCAVNSILTKNPYIMNHEQSDSELRVAVKGKGVAK